MNILPNAYLKKHTLSVLSQLRYGTLYFITPEGEKMTFTGAENGPVANLSIADWSVARNAVLRGDIGLGEDYIEGKWQTDSVEKLFSLFLMNFAQLEGFANGTLLNRLAFMLTNALIRRNNKKGSSRNIQAHYDVGNEFYSLWLDKSMTYSSALFAQKEATLERAQFDKYQRIIDKCGSDKASVLEVGCGWGGFAEQAADNDLQVKGLTISPAQYDFARKRLGGNADIQLQDYRDVRGNFDMIVSIEMFEAVGARYWQAYFRMLAERLKRGGKAVVQTITMRDDLFNDYLRHSDFIRHYVFPGGMLPSLQRFREEAAKAGLKCIDTFTFGQDYAETLRRWHQRFQSQQSTIRALGYSDAFIRNWEFYLGICAASFTVGRTDVAQLELVHA